MINNKRIRLVLLTLAVVAIVFFNIGELNAAKLLPDGESGQVVENQETKQDIEKEQKLAVYFFWGENCPHCHEEGVFLERIKDNYPEIQFYGLEVYHNQANFQLLLQMTKEKTGREASGVPVVIIGDEVITGFRDEQTTGIKIKQLLDIYALKNNGVENNGEAGLTENNYEETVKYPLLGKINLKNLSLPLLTVVLGTLDGFNPCSMWALVVLITLLINTGSKKKMWIVGGTFIVTSAVSYFLFLTAWLNAFLLIGYLLVVRLIIGTLALVAGIYFVRDYIKKRKQDTLTCEVTSSKTKNKIIDRLQNVLQKKSVLAMILGVVVIAFSVNLIELMCSAGIPAIYTQILSQSNLPSAGYYLYLLAYDFFYMLDHIVVLLIAGFTWQLLISTGKYIKYSHLIGGILLLILGAIMLISPNLLMFK